MISVIRYTDANRPLGGISHHNLTKTQILSAHIQSIYWEEKIGLLVSAYRGYDICMLWVLHPNKTFAIFNHSCGPRRAN